LHPFATFVFIIIYIGVAWCHSNDLIVLYIVLGNISDLTSYAL